MAASKQKLIIVESPAKARTITKYLGKGYKVEASQGHVRDLDHDFALKYITIRGRGDILTRIRKEARTASEIYLATDPDREGEAISWHLGQVLGMNLQEPCRIEFHEVTKRAIQNAIKNPRPIDMGRVDAQQARRVLDRLVGYKISPLLWAKVKKGLSAGRVQSVATRMVVMREQDIEAFIPEEYWDVTVKAQAHGGRGRKTHFTAKLVTLDGAKANITNGADAQKAVERIQKAHFAVYTIKRGEKRKFPAAPFTTSSLQQEASRKLGFTTAKTMQVVQQLYEGVDLEGEGTQGIVSYIRTDSVRISEEAMTALREYIPERFGPDYLPETPIEYKGRKNAQDAHEAIRPTMPEMAPDQVKDSLTGDQYKLYKLIYERFIASQMTEAKLETTSVSFDANGCTYRSTGTKVLFPGYTAIYTEGRDDGAEEEAVIPAVNAKDVFKAEKVEKEQKFSQPPARYTEASLVKLLEEKGIGRPSTYAPTISTIIERGYVRREKKQLVPTELGFVVTKIMKENFSDIVDIKFTADMESKLDLIKDGEEPWKEVIREFYGPFEKTLEKASESIEKVVIPDEVSDVKCEKCGSMMVYKMGRFGKFLACPNFPNCRNTKAIVEKTDVKCPLCGGEIIKRKSKKGKVFYGCEKYPECSFVSWDKPVKEKCPKCGGLMVHKTGHGGGFDACIAEGCGYTTKQNKQDKKGSEE